MALARDVLGFRSPGGPRFDPVSVRVRLPVQTDRCWGEEGVPWFLVSRKNVSVLGSNQTGAALQETSALRVYSEPLPLSCQVLPVR